MDMENVVSQVLGPESLQRMVPRVHDEPDDVFVVGTASQGIQKWGTGSGDWAKLPQLVRGRGFECRGKILT